MIVIWSPEAVEDLETAQSTAPSILSATGDIVRGWPYPPFRVYYQRVPDTLHVLRVYHQKREPIAR